MKILEIGGYQHKFDDDAFMQVPYEWISTLTGDDLKRMCLLRWRYCFFLDKAISEGEANLDRVFYESQQSLCKLLGFSMKSRPMVNKFLQRMEALGYISVTREKHSYDGVIKPRHFITINDKTIKASRGLAEEA